MSELSDEELSHLGLTAIGDCHRLHARCANAEEGVAMVVTENFL